MKLHIYLTIAALSAHSVEALCELDRVSCSANNLAFGDVTAFDDGIAVVGAPTSNAYGNGAGAAYAFEEMPTGFAETHVFIPPSVSISANFGRSIAVDGDRALIGAARGRTNHPGDGSAYAYRKDGSGWVFENELTPNVSGLWGTYSTAVDIDGTTAVVGAPGLQDASGNWNSGEVHVFERGPAGWAHVDRLVPGSHARRHDFGATLSISGDRIIVGASMLGAQLPAAGAVVVFERRGRDWIEVDEIRAQNSAPLDGFGALVHLAGDQAMIDRSIYGFDGIDWQYETTLPFTNPTGASSWRCADFDGEWAAIGVSGFGLIPGPSYIEVFRNTPTGWRFGGRIDGAAFAFGMSVGIDDGALFTPDRQLLGNMELFGLPGATVLIAAENPLSATSGDIRSMRVAACGGAGTSYVVLGSLSGAGPGFSVGGVTIPLAFDRYTRITAQGNSPFLTGATGVLDSTGQAYLSLQIPAPLSNVLVGSTMYHSAVLMNGNGVPMSASAPVALLVEP
jgi:hypothetical protein